MFRNWTELPLCKEVCKLKSECLFHFLWLTYLPLAGVWQLLKKPSTFCVTVLGLGSTELISTIKLSWKMTVFLPMSRKVFWNSDCSDLDLKSCHITGRSRNAKYLLSGLVFHSAKFKVAVILVTHFMHILQALVVGQPFQRYVLENKKNKYQQGIKK